MCTIFHHQSRTEKPAAPEDCSLLNKMQNAVLVEGRGDDFKAILLFMIFCCFL